jgi:hypothetical protein
VADHPGLADAAGIDNDCPDPLCTAPRDHRPIAQKRQCELQSSLCAVLDQVLELQLRAPEGRRQRHRDLRPEMSVEMSARHLSQAASE